MKDLSQSASDRLLEIFLEGLDFLADNEGYQINGTFGMLRKAALRMGMTRTAATIPPAYIGANLAFAFVDVANEINPQISNTNLYTKEIQDYEKSALRNRTRII